MYAIILAGGQGTRFWPESREKGPKQFINIIGEKSLLEQTYIRINKLVPRQNILIVVNKQHLSQIKTLLTQIPPENIIAEPLGRNTAPAICLASLYISKRSPRAVTVVLPSDHYIIDNRLFIETLKQGIDLANQYDCLLVMGIKPTEANTGYGYIKVGKVQGSPPFTKYNSRGLIYQTRYLKRGISFKNVVTAQRFIEKPDYKRAKRYFKDGDFYWNSGMFIWRVDVILKAIETHMPEHYREIRKVVDYIGTKEEEIAIRQAYENVESISIDYGVLEKAKNILLIPGEFGWSDLGSWGSVMELSKTDRDGNVLNGNILALDSKNCFIKGDRKLIATIGVKDLFVINTKDSLLICHKNKTQDVKKLVEILRKRNLREYL